VTGEEPILTDPTLKNESPIIRMSKKTEPVVGAVFLTIVTRPGHCAPSENQPGDPKRCDSSAKTEMLFRPPLWVSCDGSKYATILDEERWRLCRECCTVLFADIVTRCSLFENAIPVRVTVVKSSDARNPYTRGVSNETGERSNVPTTLLPLRTTLKKKLDPEFIPVYMLYTGGKMHRNPDTENAFTGRDWTEKEDNNASSDDNIQKKSSVSGLGPNFRGPVSKMTSPPSGRMVITAGFAIKSPFDNAQHENGMAIPPGAIPAFG
jgi:hypothetical protein